MGRRRSLSRPNGLRRAAEFGGVAEFGGAAPGGDQPAFGPELHSPGPAQRAQPVRATQLLGQLQVAAGSLGRELFGGTQG
jgi:hypothetical protein